VIHRARRWGGWFLSSALRL